MKFFQVSLALCLAVTLAHGSADVIPDADGLLQLAGITPNMAPLEIEVRALEIAENLNELLDDVVAFVADIDGVKVVEAVAEAKVYFDGVLGELDAMDRDQLLAAIDSFFEDAELWGIATLADAGFDITADQQLLVEFDRVNAEAHREFKERAMPLSEADLRELIRENVESIEALVDMASGLVGTLDVETVVAITSQIKEGVAGMLAVTTGFNYDQWREAIEPLVTSLKSFGQFL